MAVHLRDHCHAGVDGPVVKQHRAGAALTLAAAALCAGQVQVFAQHVDKQALRRGVDNGVFPVQTKANFHQSDASLRFSCTARMIFSGVSGRVVRSVCSASLTAASSAGATGTKQDSPMDLAP